MKVGRLLFRLGLVGSGAAFATTMYALRQGARPPANNPAAFCARDKQRSADERVVVFLGASMIQGRMSADLVSAVQERLPGERLTIVNAGVNGDLAYNALGRLDDVVRCAPDDVVILVGTNDVIASLGPREEQRYRRSKKLPGRPTLEWYRLCLKELVEGLRRRTHARIALCSLPMLGEELGSDENEKIRRYNDVVREVAAETGAALVDVHDALVRELKERGGGEGPGFPRGLRVLHRALVQRYVLGWSFHRVGAANGFRLLSDGVHLNEDAASIAAEAIAPFLETGARSSVASTSQPTSTR